MHDSKQIQNDSIGVRAEQGLKIEAELVLDCLDQEILVISKDFKVLYANATFLQEIGSTKEAVLGEFCYKVTHNRTSKCAPPKDPCPIMRLLETNQPTVEVHTHLDKNNKEFFVNVAAARIMQDDNCVGYLHVAIPTKNKTLQEADMDAAMQRTLDILNVIDLYQRQITDIKTKSHELEKTKEELEKRIADLEKFNALTVSREMKMIELKKRIQELEIKHAA